MKAKTLILGGALAIVFGGGPATSGPCTTEIDALTKTLSARDAGTGPTSGASGLTQSGTAPGKEHPPTAAMSQATQGQATSPEDVRRQTAGQPTAAQQGAAPQHPPTAAMNEATRGQTAPATTGQHPPTAAMTEAARGQAATRPAGSGNANEASLALGRARALDQQGKEVECMEAVGQARQLAPH